ncbi:MAG: hypothetical protein ACRDFY_10195 [Candidatus Limnocylindria bacterium]
MLVEDPFLAELIAEVREDAETIGLLLHGSRSGGQHRADSDYDLIRIVTSAAYDARRERGALLEKSAPTDEHRADVLYQTSSRIAAYVTDPGWYTPTYLSARVLFDRTGEIGALMSHIATEAGRIARQRVDASYDDYLNSFVRSLKAARRGDELGRRLHAAESATALLRTLFGLQSAWPPYHDALAAHLPPLDDALGWPPGYLSEAVLRLVRDADPTFQQQLELRVEELMASHGIAHDWGNELEPLKTLHFRDGDEQRATRPRSG